MQTKIRHVAMISERAPVLSRFYEAAFGMHISSGTTRRTAVLGDGYVGFNINGGGIAKKPGLNHYGFEVDDVAEVQARLTERYPQVELVIRPSNRPFAGISTHDPEGNIFDLSPQSATRRLVYADDGERNQRYISHFMVPAMDAPALAAFYRDVYELRELPRKEGDSSFYLTDGKVTLIVGQWKLSNFGVGGLDGKPSVDYLGFHVESLERFLADVDQMCEDDPTLTPRRRIEELQGSHTPPVYQPQPDMDETARARLAESYQEALHRLEVFKQAAIGEYQLADPDGVPLDVTER